MYQFVANSKLEAQLLLGWPVHGAKSIVLYIKVIERRYPIPTASMDPSLIDEMPHVAIFTFTDVTLQVPLKCNLKSQVMMNFD